MRDTQKILRKAVYNCLNSNITSLNGVVGVFDEKRKVSETTNLYILLSTQQETDNNTSDAFMTDSSIDIEIVHKTGFEITKDAIDDISDQILSLIIPQPDSAAGLVPDPLFQIQNVRRTSTITRNYSITESSSVISKIVTVSCLIVQQAPFA